MPNDEPLWVVAIDGGDEFLIIGPMDESTNENWPHNVLGERWQWTTFRGPKPPEPTVMTVEEFHQEYDEE
jgi:hypothetical protein